MGSLGQGVKNAAHAERDRLECGQDAEIGATSLAKGTTGILHNHLWLGLQCYASSLCLDAWMGSAWREREE